MPVLLARVGKDRLYAEAVESHIGGWFRAAARDANVRPVETPQYGYELPALLRSLRVHGDRRRAGQAQGG